MDCFVIFKATMPTELFPIVPVFGVREICIGVGPGVLRSTLALESSSDIHIFE